jgi:hypothetical protein
MYYREHKSPEEIVSYFSNPLVDVQYVDTVLTNVTFLKTKVEPPPTLIKKHIPKNTFFPGSQAQFVEMKAGGKEAFIELIKMKPMRQLAKEWGIPYHIVKNYKRDHVHGRWYESPRRKKFRILQKNKKETRPEAPKDLKTLW